MHRKEKVRPSVSTVPLSFAVAVVEQQMKAVSLFVCNPPILHPAIRPSGCLPLVTNFRVASATWLAEEILKYLRVLGVPIPESENEDA